jgi:hypothetical protein
MNESASLDKAYAELIASGKPVVRARDRHTAAVAEYDVASAAYDAAKLALKLAPRSLKLRNAVKNAAASMESSFRRSEKALWDMQAEGGS